MEDLFLISPIQSPCRLGTHSNPMNPHETPPSERRDEITPRIPRQECISEAATGGLFEAEDGLESQLDDMTKHREWLVCCGLSRLGWTGCIWSIYLEWG